MIREEQLTLYTQNLMNMAGHMQLHVHVRLHVHVKDKWLAYGFVHAHVLKFESTCTYVSSNAACSE